MRARLAALVLATAAVASVSVAQRAPARGGAAAAAATTAADSAPRDTVIMMREVFEYESSGRRDPFMPLIETTELRPALEELWLTGVLVHPTRPIAVMRDSTGAQYRVTTGMTVGRMRVVQIRPRVVVFAFTEYGEDRRDSLVLGENAPERP